LGKHSNDIPISIIFLVLAENRGLTDPAEIEQALRLGEYIKNGTQMIKASPSVFFLLLFLCIHGKN